MQMHKRFSVGSQFVDLSMIKNREFPKSATGSDNKTGTIISFVIAERTYSSVKVCSVWISI